ncbi:hypothetical protein M885DRAFT_517313 [Pelagophyceae sp. CCMP2097]|nr:hypothetical protein M885DRAFT_517313 [Pelagophyceae sp. CCMP2097]|mmetsp:Transcript_18391/g.61983  ORF Transcript_18391/g.61983 Transcript_18391/m.61983 type:complete len:182 (+) Transcript_18391:164-709(+)
MPHGAAAPESRRRPRAPAVAETPSTRDELQGGDNERGKGNDDERTSVYIPPHPVISHLITERCEASPSHNSDYSSDDLCDIPLCVAAPAKRQRVKTAAKTSGIDLSASETFLLEEAQRPLRQAQLHLADDSSSDEDDFGRPKDAAYRAREAADRENAARYGGFDGVKTNHTSSARSKKYLA